MYIYRYVCMYVYVTCMHACIHTCITMCTNFPYAKTQVSTIIIISSIIINILHAPGR